MQKLFIMYKIYRKTNYFIIEGYYSKEMFFGHIKDVFVDKNNKNNAVYKMYNIRNWNSDISIPIEKIFKEDSTPYTIEEFDSFYRQNTGNFSHFTYPQNLSKIILVESLSDLPEAVSNTIILEDSSTYIIVGDLDLLGNRIDSTNSVVNFFGLSSETSSITSTGLFAGTPLFTSNTTLKLRDITIKNVDTCLYLDKDTVMALDWDAVNFQNIPNIGTIVDCDNFIFNKGVIFNSKNFLFTGTIDTIAITDSLLQGDGLPGNILYLTNTAVVTRRIRIDKSAVVDFGATIGINISNSATIPVESYILDTVNFSGGGTYLAGIAFNNNKASFQNCKGIENTREIAQYYVNNNITPTVISAVNTPVKILGATSASAITQKFIITNNRATYIGSLTRLFKITSTISLTSGNNNQIGVYIAKNGIELNESEMYVTANGSGRAENVTAQTIVQLGTNDYIEIFIENNTITNNIIVTDINVIID